jgi:hypothetical protein
MADKADVVLIGVPKKHIVDGLSARFNLHVIPRDNAEAVIAKAAPNVRGAAVTGAPDKMMGDMMARFPKLEFVSSFGVGYDNIDIKYAVAHGITVTNTPEVLNEEVADTALGLLLCTVREFPQASNFLRAGKWMQGQYPLTKATLRDRTVGMVGMGAIGQAIVLPLVESGEILRLAREVVRPFYQRKSQLAQAWIAEFFDEGLDYHVHVSEGALFLWLWFRGMKISAETLYGRLKDRGVLIVPGHYFGASEDWRHGHECIRLSFAMDESSVREGIAILAEEVAKGYL